MAGALHGIRCIECGQGISAAYAAKLFADLGADVVKVEPPDGDCTRLRGPFPGDVPNRDASGLFIYLNTNKRGLNLDLTTDDGRSRLEDLAESADVLIHNFAPAAPERLVVDPAHLLRVNPRLVIVDITVFGRSGPHAGYDGTDLIALSAGGLTYICGAEPGRPDQEPLRPFGGQSEFQAGCNAAVAALGALFARQRTGRGQWIDVASREVITSILGVAVTQYTYTGYVPTRLGTRSIQPWAFMECEDGPILVFCVENEEWQRLVELLGSPEWASWPIFDDRFSRAENWDVLKPLLQEEVRKWRVRDLYEAAQERRVPLAPVSSMRDLFESPQLRHRRYFVEHEDPDAGPLRMPGRPYVLSRTPWELRTHAPRLGQCVSNDALAWDGDRGADPKPFDRPGTAPLSGVRVLDFTWVWAGPYCAMQFAHLGAEVIKVESERRLDTTRRFQPFADQEPGVNRSGYFNQYNLGKRSITLNLATDEGQALARRLAETADIIIDNYTPGTMKRWGLDYASLSEVNPGIICVSLSGYGTDGPESRFISYGPTQEPLTGLSSLSGYVGGPPGDLGLSYGDPNAGIHAAFATLAALWYRRRTGQGQQIDVSLMETSINVIPEGVISQSMNGYQPPRMGNRDRWMSPHGVFPCRGEDRWVAIAVRSDREFGALAEAMGMPGLASDPRFISLHERKAHERDLEAMVRGWTMHRDPLEVAETLQAKGVPAFPVMTMEVLLSDPHLQVREFFVRLPHPEVGVRPVAGIPWRTSAGDVRVRCPAPLLGEANDYVFREVLGLDEATIADLRSRGVMC